MLFFAVLRFSDKRIVATYSAAGEVDKEGIRELIAGNPSCIAGKKYSSKGTTQVVNYTLDASGRVYVVVTNNAYSTRVAFAVVEELQETFLKEYGQKVPSATEESLSKPSKKLFLMLFEKYCNPSKVDQLSNVQNKLEVVKSTMQENIQQMLKNDELVAKIDVGAEKLNDQSVAFKQGAKQLKGKQLNGMHYHSTSVRNSSSPLRSKIKCSGRCGRCASY